MNYESVTRINNELPLLLLIIRAMQKLNNAEMDVKMTQIDDCNDRSMILNMMDVTVKLRRFDQMQSSSPTNCNLLMTY